MGILEQVQSGYNFIRGTTTITNTTVSSSTTAFGPTYILLSVTVDNPCRIRLYSDSASVALDDARTTASFDIADAVGLTLDTLITQSSYTLNFDPPIIGTTFSGSQTWYNISGSNVTATFTYYPIEYDESYRTELVLTQSTLPVSPLQSLGDLSSPRSFLILSASCNYNNVRLRLYSRGQDGIPGTELARAFGDIPAEGSTIITDMVFDSASYAYKLTPVLQAYNLDNYLTANQLVGYVIENLTGTEITNVTASLYIYPLED